DKQHTFRVRSQPRRVRFWDFLRNNCEQVRFEAVLREGLLLRSFSPAKYLQHLGFSLRWMAKFYSACRRANPRFASLAGMISFTLLTGAVEAQLSRKVQD